MAKRKYVRKLRHWKQQFDKNAEFIWARNKKYAGEQYEAGDPIPKDLFKNKTKLRRFWESNVIELAQFEAPDVATGRVEEYDLPEGVTVEETDSSWIIIHTPDGDEKVNGKNALQKRLEELRQEAAVASEGNEDDNSDGNEDDNSGGNEDSDPETPEKTGLLGKLASAVGLGGSDDDTETETDTEDEETTPTSTGEGNDDDPDGSDDDSWLDED